MSTVWYLSLVLMVSKKALVRDARLPFEFGYHSSLVWSGRIPEHEEATTLDNEDNATEQKHQVVSSLVSIVDKQEHMRRRRPWTRGFSTSALKDYEGLVIKRTLQLVEVLLSKNLKEAVDLTSLIGFFGYAKAFLALN